jgi:DnaK suppressor protein
MLFPSELLEKIRLQLEAEKKELEERMSELSKQDPFANPDRLNDNAASDTDASEESNHDRVEAIVLELKTKLTEINDALMRVGSGKYGICKNCGNVIDTDRLDIVPETILCLNCEKARQAKIPKSS